MSVSFKEALFKVYYMQYNLLFTYCSIAIMCRPIVKKWHNPSNRFDFCSRRLLSDRQPASKISSSSADTASENEVSVSASDSCKTRQYTRGVVGQPA